MRGSFGEWDVSVVFKYPWAGGNYTKKVFSCKDKQVYRLKVHISPMYAHAMSNQI